jgi:hypothetical protein
MLVEEQRSLTDTGTFKLAVQYTRSIPTANLERQFVQPQGMSDTVILATI